MSKRTGAVLCSLAVLALAVGFGWWLTEPRGLVRAADLPAHRIDLTNGETMFNAGNCSGCHQSPGQDDPARLGGGLRLASPFGVFVAPNISSDAKTGLGAWTEAEFINAMKRGVDRRGEHLYPAFPYPSYSRMKTSDVRDLFAYLKTLPPVTAPNQPHALRLPFNIRRSVGVWKLLYFRPAEFAAVPTRSAEWNRGAYLAEGPAHCAECHTPRTTLGGMDRAQAYVGAPSLETGGRFASNITPSKDGIGDWTAADLAELLSTGTDKCFNAPRGMVKVLAATQRLAPQDNAAIAAYIHALPPAPGNGDHKGC